MFTSDNSILMCLSARSISSTTNTPSFQLNVARNAAVVLSVGDTSTTIDFKLQYSPDNTNWNDIPGKSINTLSATDDNREAVINVSDEEVEPNSYVRAVITPGVGTASVCVLAIGDNLRYAPASHVSSVVRLVR